MKPSKKHFLCAVLVSSLLPAIAQAQLWLDNAPAAGYDGPDVPKATGIEASFPEETLKDRVPGQSLYGAKQHWERNQNDAWGGGIPGLSSDEGQNGCGLIAAEALVRYFANDPNLDKIREITTHAEQQGLWASGMKGPGSEQKLLSDFGVQTDMIWGINDQAVRESLDRGKPVIISTRQHYFVAEGYNSNGQLFVGYSGTVKRSCGSMELSLSRISACSGGEVVLLIPK